MSGPATAGAASAPTTAEPPGLVGGVEYESRGAGASAVLPAGRPLPGRWMLGVVLFAATLLLPTLGGWRVLTRHEVLAAEPAREMLHGGRAINWIIPQFGGEPRAVKPPTMGWLIAGSMALFHSEAEWVARLPSGLAAVLMAALMADLTSRWLGPRVGAMAGLLQATFVYVLMQGRLAEADMPMAAAVCLAMYAFARGCVADAGATDAEGAWRRSRRLSLLFYLGTGLSFLLKGVGPVFVLATVVSYLALCAVEKRDLRTARQFLLNPWGLLLLVAMTAGLLFAAWRAEPNIFKIWRQETVGRFGGEFGERQPWYYYLGAVPVLLMPWLPFALGGVYEGFKRRVCRGAVGQFLLCWFVPGLLILSASAWKHHHYAIPMLPAATPAAAAGMALWLRQIRDNSAAVSEARRIRQGRLAAVLWAAACTAVALGVWRFAKTGAAQMAMTVGLLAAGGAVVAWAVGRGRPTAAMAGVFATAWAVAVAVGLLVIPRFEEYRYSADLARRANAVVPAGATIYLASVRDDHAEYHVAYYLRLPVRRVNGKDEVARWLADSPGGDLFAICTVSLLPTLRSANGVTGVAEIAHADRLRRFETESDRQVFVRIARNESSRNR